MKTLGWLDVQSTDAARNLALEQYVFDALPRDRDYLLLWRNENAVIIGKHQNTAAEINAAAGEEQGVQVVRRLSGGGAVYHDLGNLNFTFITDAPADGDLDFGRFCRPVVALLQRLGVEAELSGRNDMTIAGQKFSGNAQYMRQGRVMHHGTILFDSDLEAVARVLQSHPEKFQGKATRSVRSRVTNVRPHLREDMELAAFRAALLSSLLADVPHEKVVLTEADEAAIDALRRERYATWEWNYGYSPACTAVKAARIPGCGSVEAHLDIEEGVIQKITFTGDFFSPHGVERLAERLRGVRLEHGSLTEVLADFDVKSCIAGLHMEALTELLCH